MKKSDVELIAQVIGEEIDARMAALPRPKDGDPGKSVTLEDVAPLLSECEQRALAEIRSRIAATVSEAVAAIPRPKDGKSVEPEVVQSMVLEAVRAAVAEIPRPKDGKDTDPDVTRQMVAAAVAELPRPKDGKSVTVDDVAPMVEALFSKSLVDYERRFGESLAKAIEKIPTPKNGVDGLSIEDLDVTHDGDGNVTLKFSRGDVSREFSIRLPRMVDRGVYREGTDYLKGDGVTFGGSFWFAKIDNPQGKPGVSDDWRLAVKKGRDA